VGGATVSAVRLGQALNSLGDEIFIFSSAPRGRPSGFFEFNWGIIRNKHISAPYMSISYLLIFALISFFGLFRFCKKNKIEMLSSHSGNLILCFIPSIIGKLLKIPVVHTQYCEVSSKRTLLNFFSWLLLKVNFFTPDKFVAISRNVQSSLLDANILRQKVVVIPPIIPSYNEKQNTQTFYRKKFGFSDDDFIVLFIGNLKHNKGVDVLLKSFFDLTKTLSKLKLVVTTELVHQDMWERKTRLQQLLSHQGLVKRVVWLRFVDDMIKLIKDVDVVVVPFLNLNGISDYPLVVLEAISVGTPVIATNVGGISEVLSKDLGLLVPAGNVDALNKGLLAIMRNKDKFRRRKKSHLHLNRFNSVVIGRQYQSLFCEEMK